MAVNTNPPHYIARGQRRARTHEHILEVSADLLYRSGIQQVSMDDVAAAAGVTKATLHKHFESKDKPVSPCLTERDRKHFDCFVAHAPKRTHGSPPALPPPSPALYQ